MILNFTIIPVFRRDLVAAAREREGRRLHSERSSFAGMLAAIVLGTFGAWFYWSDGYVTHRTMTRGVNEAASWCLLVHFGIFGSILVRGAWSIAKERDRRTLEFLLATPMTNAEIVLGKLASCVVMACATMAAGLPVVLLLHVLGGIDLRLIALCYVELRVVDPVPQLVGDLDFSGGPGHPFGLGGVLAWCNGLVRRPVQRVRSSYLGSASACPIGWQPRTGGSFSAAPSAWLSIWPRV